MFSCETMGPQGHITRAAQEWPKEHVKEPNLLIRFPISPDSILTNICGDVQEPVWFMEAWPSNPQDPKDPLWMSWCQTPQDNPKSLLSLPHVSELLWQYKGNLCNNVNVVADRCMCYPLSVTDGRKQKVTEARNARKSYLILQGSWQDFIKAQTVQYLKNKK